MTWMPRPLVRDTTCPQCGDKFASELAHWDQYCSADCQWAAGDYE